jgi:hypothetical protein
MMGYYVESRIVPYKLCKSKLQKSILKKLNVRGLNWKIKDQKNILYRELERERVLFHWTMHSKGSHSEFTKSFNFIFFLFFFVIVMKCLY